METTIAWIVVGVAGLGTLVGLFLLTRWITNAWLRWLICMQSAPPCNQPPRGLITSSPITRHTAQIVTNAQKAATARPRHARRRWVNMAPPRVDAARAAGVQLTFVPR